MRMTSWFESVRRRFGSVTGAKRRGRETFAERGRRHAGRVDLVQLVRMGEDVAELTRK